MWATFRRYDFRLPRTAPHCNALQCTATHLVCTLQQSATHCNTLQHTATHCNTLHTLQHTATHCNTLQYTFGTGNAAGVTHFKTHFRVQHTLQHTSTPMLHQHARDTRFFAREAVRHKQRRQRRALRCEHRRIREKCRDCTDWFNTGVPISILLDIYTCMYISVDMFRYLFTFSLMYLFICVHLHV